MSYCGGNLDDYLLRCQKFERSCKNADEVFRKNTEAVGNHRISIDTLMEETKTDVEFKMDQIKQELTERDKFIVNMREQLHLEVPKADPISHQNRLEQRYMAALKKDEKLEAEAQRSLTEVNIDLEKHTAQLKQLHSTQVIEYLLMQDQIKDNFKRDMDNLMKKFDAEMSRFRKENSEVLANNQIKEKKNLNAVSSTHQP